MTTDGFPLADVSPPALLLSALALNLLLCSSSRVGGLMSLPMDFAGRLIRTLEQRYNHPHVTDRTRRTDSVSVAIVLVIVGILIGLGLGYLLSLFPYSWLPEAALVAVLLNVRPHLERMRILARALDEGEEEARATLSLVTGRDAGELDRSGIAAAGIESSAMALTQGLIAPVAWYLLGGLPALFAFKIVDTASVMIDERSENARSFGWAPRGLAAIFLVPALVVSVPAVALAALLVPKARPLATLGTFALRGRYAWPAFTLPVAAVAGALGVQLGGPVCIGRFRREGDVLGAGGSMPDTADLVRARSLQVATGLFVALALSALAWLQVGHPLKLF